MKCWHLSVSVFLFVLVSSFCLAGEGKLYRMRFPAEGSIRILFLHHSTGWGVWEGGVPMALEAHNRRHGKNYRITEKSYPNSPYPWKNNPYDYWNLWVAHTKESTVKKQANLDMLVKDYDIIVFKHCFPVCRIGPDEGQANIASSVKSLQNYQLQYKALKVHMREFPDKRFLVWTGAALRQEDATEEQAKRAKTFFDWVINEWDEKGDNIFVWDFYGLETEGSLYLKEVYASKDPHPNSSFNRRVAPLFVKRLVDIIEGRGDEGSITGE